MRRINALPTAGQSSHDNAYEDRLAVSSRFLSRLESPPGRWTTPARDAARKESGGSGLLTPFCMRCASGAAEYLKVGSFYDLCDRRHLESGRTSRTAAPIIRIFSSEYADSARREATAAIKRTASIARSGAARKPPASPRWVVTDNMPPRFLGEALCDVLPGARRSRGTGLCRSRRSPYGERWSNFPKLAEPPWHKDMAQDPATGSIQRRQ